MEKFIETKRFFYKIFIELSENCIKIRHTDLFKHHEFEVNYENIENKKTVEKQVNVGLILISSVVFVVGLLYITGNHFFIALTLMIVSIVLALMTFLFKRKTITISGMAGEQVNLFFNNSNENEIRNFADKILKFTNNYLLCKYGKIDKDLPIEGQLENLYFLRNRNVINDDEFQDLKKQLLNKDNKTVGFYDLKK